MVLTDGVNGAVDMTERYVLGIDIGTTGTKCLLVSDARGIVASAYESYPTRTPALGQREQNAEDWWNAVIKTVRSVSSDAGVSGGVRAISLSTQGGTLVPVDERLSPLAPAIIWSDNRCLGDREAVERALGKGYFYDACGWKLGKGLPAMQLRRMRLERPELFTRAAKFLTVPDYIASKMTGRAAIDLSNAGINQWVNVRDGVYDKKILEYVGVGTGRLPELVRSGEVIGQLTDDAANALGLRKDTLLVAGAHDQYAVALGAGVSEAGDAVIGTGTAWVVMALSDEPDFQSGFSQSVSASPGKWGSLVSVSAGGACLDWFRKNIACGADGAPLDFGAIDTEVARRLQRDDGLTFYPYFNGSSPPEADGCSKGTMIGLDFSHDRFDIARAVMEGVACQIAWALEALSAKHPVRRLKVAGGATKSPVWMQMVAGLAGRPVITSDVADLGCVGAAVLAQAGCGIVASVSEGGARLDIGARTICPEPGSAARYERVLSEYKAGAGLVRKLYAERGERIGAFSGH